jgi:hypothetical protein
VQRGTLGFFKTNTDKGCFYNEQQIYIGQMPELHEHQPDESPIHEVRYLFLPRVRDRRNNQSSGQTGTTPPRENGIHGNARPGESLAARKFLNIIIPPSG